jgi:hypothetical protein
MTWNGECLFDNNRNNNEYNNVEDGNGLRRGAEKKGESDYDSRDVIRGPFFGGVGHRTSIVGPHATATVIDNNNSAFIKDNVDNNCRSGGGASCPPPLRSIPSRRMLFVIVNVTNRGQRWWHGGIRGVVIHKVEEEEVSAVVLVCQVPIQPGVDNGVLDLCKYVPK